MHIEHFVPRSHAPERTDDYKNCFYACRRCNIERGIKSVQGPDGARLLNPCDVVWGQRFRLTFDRIWPRDGEDRNALYTIKSFQLNDPSKVELRAARRKIINQSRDFLDRWESFHERLLDSAVARGVEGAERVEDLKEEMHVAKLLAGARRRALWDLHRYVAIPLKYDVSCRCEDPSLCTLPKILEDQTFSVPELI